MNDTRHVILMFHDIGLKILETAGAVNSTAVRKSLVGQAQQSLSFMRKHIQSLPEGNLKEELSKKSLRLDGEILKISKKKSIVFILN